MVNAGFCRKFSCSCSGESCACVLKSIGGKQSILSSASGIVVLPKNSSCQFFVFMELVSHE